jgi:hypothetical protein
MGTAEEAPAQSDVVGAPEAVTWYALAPDEVASRLGVEPGSVWVPETPSGTSLTIA